jgi:chromosomal replication initiation ATPase DnaA
MKNPIKLIAKIEQDYGLEKGTLASPSRERFYVNIRAKTVKKLRKMGLSYPMIGRLLNRDHTSIIHLNRREETKVWL